MDFLKNKKHSLSVAVLCVLIAVTVLFSCGCGKANDTVTTDTEASAVETVKEVGQGATSFTFKVENGSEKATFLVKTDKTTVGEALVELGLIAGDQSDFGLYVKTVNGVTVDYDKDGSYWAFYVDDAYATSGVDSTQITEGAVYSFKVEK